MRVKLKDNYYLHTNGAYLKHVKVPSGSDQFSFADKLQKSVLEQLGTLNPNSSSPFTTTLHSDMRETESLSEYSLIQEIINRIDSMQSVTEVPDVLFDLHSYGCAPLFTVNSASDFNNPGTEIIYLEESEPYWEQVSEKYIQKLLEKFKVKENTRHGINTFEKKLHSKMYNHVQKRDVRLNYNPIMKLGMQHKYSWLCSYFGNLNSFPNRVNLDNPKMYQTVQKMLRESKNNLQSWKSYLLLNWLDHVAPLFSDLYKDHCKVHCAVYVDGPSKSIIEHKVHLASQVWWKDAGQQYVNHFVDPTTKEHANYIFTDVKAAFIKILETSELEAPTKAEAIAKINKMGVHLAWADSEADLFLEPSKIYQSACKDYSFEENYLIGCNFNFWNIIAQSQQKTNPAQWREMGYAMANACYISEYNALYIPAALMQPPYLYTDNILTSYPGIGRVMVHEMSHAVDSQGKHIDSDGRMRDWWTPKDARQYNESAKKTIQLYSNYYSNPIKKINGLLTLTENISDLMALRTSWFAYLNRWSLTFKKNQVPLEVQKKFFKQLAFSRMFKAGPKVRAQNLLDDPHSPPEARTNIPLSVSPPFYRLFGIKESDNMFVPSNEWPRFFKEQDIQPT
jgi:predicted metalloendopeptidase